MKNDDLINDKPLDMWRHLANVVWLFLICFLLIWTSVSDYEKFTKFATVAVAVIGWSSSKMIYEGILSFSHLISKKKENEN